tara:strand:+ start:4974 stop:5432 length:459 start_codon:yes stop_codon:yes gene_type:complete
MKIYGYQTNLKMKPQAYLYFVGKNDELHRVEIIIPAVTTQADRFINSLFGGGILYKFNNYSEAEDHYADTLERIRNMQSPFDSEIEMDKYYNDRLSKENKELKEVISNKYKQDLIKETMADNEIANSNIGRKFMEDAINDMYDEQDDPFTGF